MPLTAEVSHPGGQFLPTGSSRLLDMRDLPDTWPGGSRRSSCGRFSQGEIDRDVRELAQIERVPQLRTLVRLLAARCARQRLGP